MQNRFTNIFKMDAQENEQTNDLYKRDCCILK
jgi:hypothetical protein